MTQSDFLILISIFLAIVAICVANNKKIWMYKFTYRIIIVVICFIVLINGLIFYDELAKRGLEIKCLHYSLGFNSKTWAYIFSICFVLGLGFYISSLCKHFPRRQYSNIINYYRSLIDSDTGLLLSYIDTYHKINLLELIEYYNKTGEEEETKGVMQECSEEVGASENTHKKRFFSFQELENKILHEIILSKHFVDKVIPIAPFWFLDLVSNFSTDRISNSKETIAYYIQNMIREKKGELIGELNEMFSHDDQETINLLNNTYYLKLIFSDNCFVSRFDLLQIIGKEAIREVESGCSFFMETVSEWRNDEYEHCICYQFLLLYNLAYRFFSSINLTVKDNKVTIDESLYLPQFGYLPIICKAITASARTTDTTTYAYRFIEDARNHLKNTMGFCEEKNHTRFLKSMDDNLNEINTLLKRETTSEI